MENLRYARQIALGAIGAAGQEKLSAGHVLLVGVGGLGCPVATYLAAAGVGHLTINDYDSIDETNLARQFLFAAQDSGRNKATVATERLSAANPGIRIEAVTERLAGPAMQEHVAMADVVVDATDNFQTRQLINEASVAASRILIVGAAIGMSGQLLDLGPDYTTSPCYQCVYPAEDDVFDDCRGNGILGPVAGTIGSSMATRALLRLLGGKRAPDLSIHDGATQEWRSIKLKKRSDCPVCTRA